MHDFYQRTFSSPLELLALLKRNPQQDGAKLSDPEINQELLHAIYDHLDDLVSINNRVLFTQYIYCLGIFGMCIFKPDMKTMMQDAFCSVLFFHSFHSVNNILTTHFLSTSLLSLPNLSLKESSPVCLLQSGENRR